MGIVLVLAGTFVYLRVAADLSSSIDDSLRTRVDDLARQLQTADSDEVGLGGPRDEGAEDILSEVLRLDGTVVASSEGPPQKSVLDAAELARARAGLTYFDAASVPGIEGEARLLARPVEAEDGSFVVVTGASKGTAARRCRAWPRRSPSVARSRCCSRRRSVTRWPPCALRPVEAMSARAARITLEHSGERLPLPPADDEIGRLGRTLNEMLARIETSIERERAFVADAGHELRTPIAILRSELELGLRPDRDLDEARAAMSSAIEEAARLQRLAEDLLALARSDGSQLPIEPRRVAIAELLARTRSRFLAKAEAEGRAIEVEAGGALVWKLDPGRIESVLGNLVENSIRHGGGTITLSGREDGDQLELVVADQGPGFPPGFGEHAFERFSRAEAGRTTAGSGLGLAIVRAVAEAHGGSVSAGRVEPHGAVLTVRIPRTPGCSSSSRDT